MEGSRSPLNGPVQSFQDLELLIVSGYTVYIHGERRRAAAAVIRAHRRENRRTERDRGREGRREGARERDRGS